MKNRNLELLESTFKSDKPQEVITLIIKLRTAPPFEGLITLLADIFSRSDDKDIKDAIRGFFNDMKSQQHSVELISTALKIENSDTKVMLISSAWQSGLDYSAHAESIINLFLSGNMALAIECYSVLSEAVTIPEAKERSKFTLQIGAKLESLDTAKKGLAEDIIKMLESNSLPGVTHVN